MCNVLPFLETSDEQHTVQCPVHAVISICPMPFPLPSKFKLPEGSYSVLQSLEMFKIKLCVSTKFTGKCLFFISLSLYIFHYAQIACGTIFLTPLSLHLYIVLGQPYVLVYLSCDLFPCEKDSHYEPLNKPFLLCSGWIPTLSMIKMFHSVQ